MRQYAKDDFDRRNRRHWKEEDQRIGSDVLAAIKKLAERTGIGIVLRWCGRVLMTLTLVFLVRRHAAVGLNRGGDFAQEMDVGLGGITLQQESQQHQAGEEQAARMP